jgi:hypothetical protein
MRPPRADANQRTGPRSFPVRSPVDTERIMKKTRWIVLIGMIYLLHQDFWHWHVARPLFLGILPIGLTYHVFYTIAVAGVMALLVHFAWPSYLEQGLGEAETEAHRAGEDG